MKTNLKTMGKRVLSFLMAFAMILSMAQAISPTALVKAAEETESATYPSITAVDQYDSCDTFTISTAEEFAALATNVNAGKTYEGKTVLVTADLDFSAYKDTYWTPIGIATGNYEGTHPFKGHFDGQLHHFKNIDMKFTGNRKGLFGFAEGAVFENIILDEGTLTTVNSRLDGVLCAAVNSCTFRNIENHVSVVDSSNYDLWNIGIVSHCKETTFEAVVNYGSITGKATATGQNGGIASWCSTNSTVSHCYMAGTVTGTQSNIIARGSNTTTITNSYYVTADDKGTISKADFASGQTAWNLNTLSGTRSNASIWFATENGPVLRATDTTSVSNVDQYDNYDTFTISTAKEFADLATNVNAGYFYEGKTVLVTADLDFSGYKDKVWTPIGIATGNYTGTHPFKGHFDGQFHHFKNINMKLTGYRQALFGYIQNALIENIILDEGTLTGASARWPGLLTSQANGATIRNIENHVSLVDTSNYGYWNAGFVSHCANTSFVSIVNYGSVKGTTTAIGENGGFMSWGHGDSPVNHCYMTGTVTGTSSNILGRGRGTTTNSYYVTADDKGTITKANFISGKTAWNLNTFTGTKENAGLWSTTANGPVLDPNKATYKVKVSKFDVDGNALGEATYYCNQGDTFTLDTTGFKIPVCTLNGATLDGTSFTMPKGESVVTITEGLDISAIQAAVDAANTAMTGIQVIDGKTTGEVDNGIEFVTTDEMQALTDAIAAVEAVKETATTVEEVTNAVTALNTAIDTFNGAIKVGCFVPVILMDGINYGSFADANAAYAGKPMKLLADIGTAEAPAQLTQDIYVDLNGHNMYANAEEGKLNLIDSTADYAGTEGSATVTGTVESLVEYDGKKYMVIGENGVYAPHCYYVGITNISLAPNVTGFGYKAEFYGDAAVQAQVANIGFDLWLSENRVISKTTGFKNTLTLRLKNFMVEQYGETPVNAKVYMTLTDGTKLESAIHSYSMRSVVEEINNTYASFEKAQLKATANMIYGNATMEGWNVENIMNSLIPEVSVEAATVENQEMSVMGGEAVSLTLNGAYVFKAQEETATAAYADWTADYYITMDQAAGEGLYLAGNYGTYGWIAIPVEAGQTYTDVPVVATLLGTSLTYEEVVTQVGTFTCGVADTNSANTGATVTVELRLTNPETNEYIVINTAQITL